MATFEAHTWLHIDTPARLGSCVTATASASGWVAGCCGEGRGEAKGYWGTAVIIRSAVTHLHALDGLNCAESCHAMQGPARVMGEV